MVPIGWSLSTKSGAIWETGSLQRGSAGFTSRKSVTGGAEGSTPETFRWLRHHYLRLNLRTLVETSEQVLQEDLAALLAVLEAVERPLLQQGLAAAVHVSVEEAWEPLLQQGVDVVHHLAKHHAA